MSWRRVATGALLTISLGGCALDDNRTVAAPGPASAVVHDDFPGCAALVPDPAEVDNRERHDAGVVPAGFEPSHAVLCAAGDRTAANGDRVRVQLERTATEIAPLVDYLARPSRTAVDSDHLSCPAIAIPPPALFLVSADRRWIDPTVSTDACGFPLDALAEAGPAYRNLDYVDRVVSTGEVTETAAARKAGCAMQWKNVVTVEAAGASPAAATTDPWSGAALRRSRYAVPEADRGSDAPGGDFVSGGRLGAAAGDDLRRALASSRSAEPCSTPAGTFVVLQTIGGSGPLAYVELDGCRRVLVAGQPNRIAQATPTLIGLLER